MDYRIEFEDKNDYVHVRVTGEKSVAAMRLLFADINRAHRRHGFSKVLIEERLVGPPLPTLDIYDIVARASEHCGAKYDAAAYVQVSPDSNIGFAENIAVNRGAALMAFSSLDAAAEWLRD